jgi:hypothetical protein
LLRQKYNHWKHFSVELSLEAFVLLHQFLNLSKWKSMEACHRSCSGRVLYFVFVGDVQLTQS